MYFACNVCPRRNTAETSAGTLVGCPISTLLFAVSARHLGWVSGSEGLEDGLNGKQQVPVLHKRRVWWWALRSSAFSIFTLSVSLEGMLPLCHGPKWNSCLARVHAPESLPVLPVLRGVLLTASNAPVNCWSSVFMSKSHLSSSLVHPWGVWGWVILGEQSSLK